MPTQERDAMSQFPDPETESAFLGYLEEYWPTWRQYVDGMRWHELRKAFIAGRLAAAPAADGWRIPIRADIERHVALALSDGEYLGRHDLPPVEKINLYHRCLAARVADILAVAQPANTPAEPSYFDRSQGANTFNPEAQFDADRAKEGL